MSKYILDENGNPQRTSDILEWGRFAETDRHVAEDKIGDVRVSTVFLGLDHSYDGGPPVLWETMIFGGEHDQHQERYTSRKDAEAGHAKAVALVKGGAA